MDASKFLKKLKDLGIKDFDDIKLSDIEWIFHDKNLSSVQNFFEWITNNVGEEDVLTDEELRRYDELKENGRIYSLKYIERLNNIECDTDTFLPMNDNSKNDQTDLYEMELHGNIEKRKEIISQMEKKVRNLEIEVELSNKEYEKEKKTLTSSLDNFLSELRNFTDSDADTHLVQLPFNQWFREHEKYSTCLQEYINKQFNHLGLIIDGEKEDQCYFLDSAKLDTKLAKGDDKAMYNVNAKELKRVSKMIESAELEKIMNDIDKSKHVAELSELESFLGSSSLLTNVNVMRQKQSELAKMNNALDKEIHNKLEELKQNIKSVVSLERSKVISGDYQAKQKRQKYVLEKQKNVMEAFIKQMAHFDFMRICIEIEKKELLKITELIKEMCTFFQEKEDRSVSRQDLISKTLSRKAAIIEKVPEYLQVDNEEVGASNCEDNKEEILENLRNIQSKKKSNMEKMQKLCSVFDKCIFGDKNDSCTLPPSWLNSDILEKYYTLDKDMRSFKQDTYSVIKDLEKNKQALSVNPDLRDQLFDWTK